MSRRQTRPERFLDWGIRIIKKTGELAKAGIWIEKVYKNEMVREIYKAVISWLL